ncbi:MAG TPA: VCBS repeat-containing protein [Verrucomicrobiae bacterium]|nr:VCBS repeat-containing protein [Verrucomicrobiae bacterium]
MNSLKRCITRLAPIVGWRVWIPVIALSMAPRAAQAQSGSGLFMRNAQFVFAGLNTNNNPLALIDVGFKSRPAFVDIDADGDQDLFVGSMNGTIHFFENVGTSNNAVFADEAITPQLFSGVDVGSDSAPAFADLDSDGDFDAVIGHLGTGVFYYENTGVSNAANFILRTGTNDPFDAAQDGLGGRTSPTLIDINGDGRVDLVSGTSGGTLQYCQNTGSLTDPAFTFMEDDENPFDGIDVGIESAPFAVDRNGNGRPEGFLVGRQNAELRVVVRNGVNGPFRIPGDMDSFPLVDIEEIDGRCTPAMVDLDGDGLWELVIGGDLGKAYYLKPTGLSFFSWQGQYFTLPAQATNAAPAADPDGDRIVNFLEYAIGSSPLVASNDFHFSASLNGLGQFTFSLAVRDDDPQLALAAQVSGNITFEAPTLIQPVVSDPDVDDGLKTLTFTDVSGNGAGQSFLRLQFNVQP